MLIEIDENVIPNGWRAVRFGIPQQGEFILWGKETVKLVTKECIISRLIIERVEPSFNLELIPIGGANLPMLCINRVGKKCVILNDVHIHLPDAQYRWHGRDGLGVSIHRDRGHRHDHRGYII